MISLGMVMLFSCQNSYEEVNKVSGNELQPYAESFDTEIIYSEKGKKNSRLLSEHIQRFNAGDTVWTEMPKGLQAYFYDSIGRLESTMKADYGLWLEERGTVYAEKDVIITNVKGEQLNTEKLTWYQDSGIFVTREFVKITQPTGVIYGNGLRAKQNFEEYEIMEITGNIAVEE
ncbi:LPS export ABC transporter periplasmic protein LptC [Luteibaculum oceani]|nr:LPS export ABC transporter periplasmic protein LptC [Luteibaculum oceani]